MLAHVVRNGLIESTHDGAIAAVDGNGRLRAVYGDVGRSFFLRSAAKPFQATVAQELGAALSPQQMALACASHGGQPVHVAIVCQMLAEVGLDARALACPPTFPFGTGARERLIAAGHRRPRSLWHNCSGKHAAMLRACVARGWPVETYAEPEHPLQVRIAEVMEDALGENHGPAGVDGCGVPAFRGTVRSLAGAYARLATDVRFRAAWNAMHRYPALTSDLSEPAARIAAWLDAAAKHGAEGCLGVAVRNTMGIGVKVWDGGARAVGVAAVEALRQLGLVPPGTGRYLEDVARPPVLGGGNRQGSIEPDFELRA